MTKRANNATCVGLTAAGEACPAPALRDDPSGHCLWHTPDPQRQLQALVARSTGSAISRLKGRHWNGDGREIIDPDAMLRVISDAISDLGATVNNPQRATALAVLSKEWREVKLMAIALGDTAEVEVIP
jgi:hypothetical protein